MEGLDGDVETQDPDPIQKWEPWMCQYEYFLVGHINKAVCFKRWG